MHGDEDLSELHWVNNIVRLVLFSHAVYVAALTGGAFNIVIKMGSHASLKGPTLETLHESRKESILYTDLLYRENDDVEAFSNTLGYLWSQFSCSMIDFGTFDSLASGRKNRSLMNGLPTSYWDH